MKFKLKHVVTALDDTRAPRVKGTVIYEQRDYVQRLRHLLIQSETGTEVKRQYTKSASQEITM